MSRTFWLIFIAVLIGALIAGGFLAIQYAKQQVDRVRRRIWYAMTVGGCEEQNRIIDTSLFRAEGKSKKSKV
jgi:hypothetical protein